MKVEDEGDEVILRLSKEEAEEMVKLLEDVKEGLERLSRRL